MLDGDALPAGKASMSPFPDPCVRPGELLLLLGSSNRVTRTPRKMTQMQAPPQSLHSADQSYCSVQGLGLAGVAGECETDKVIDKD
jgi:hypothetical protein